MRLFLSSEGLSDQPDSLLSLVEKDNLNALLIPNASNDETEEQRRKDLEGLGFTVETLDLQQFYESRNGELIRRLGRAGLIWVLGGDSSKLAETMNKSKFTETAEELVTIDKIAYGGEGAGAEIAGRGSVLNLHFLPIVTGVGTKEARSKVEAYSGKILFQPLPPGSALMINNGKQTYIHPKRHENNWD